MKPSILLISLVVISTTTQAQFLDSLQLEAGSIATISSQSYQPLWLVANRFGTIADRQSDLSSNIKVSNKHVYYGSSPLYDYLRNNGELPYLALEYGIDIYNHNHFQKTFIQEAYVKFNYNHWQLRAGRYEEISGEVDSQLSSGSLGISGNALPVPKIGLAVTEYTDVPFTGGWLQFKGRFSHGWMGKDRSVNSAFFHERALYLRIGHDLFRLYGGVNRFVIWGGEHPNEGRIDSSWEAYRKVVLGGPIDRDRFYPEAVGNHSGFIDLGLQLNLREIEVLFYHQTPYENRSGFNPLGNSDKLTGVSFRNRNENTVLTAFTIEYLDTRHQTEENNQGFDNYYNGHTYRSGWTYLKRIIGTPLFVTKDRAAQYLKGPVNGAERWQVISNRVRGIHLGWIVRPLSYLQLRTLATYTKNYGNHSNDGQFNPPREQWYFLQEAEFVQPNWTLTAALAVDAGEMTGNQGFLIGLKYNLKSLNEQFTSFKMRKFNKLPR